MGIIKKSLIASAVAMAVAGSASAGFVTFDVNGAAGANTLGVDRFNIDVFDWTPGNLLIKDTVPPGAVVGTDVTAYAQSALTGITRGGVTQFSYGAIPGQLTYQVTLNLATAAAGASGIKYSQGALTGTFEIFYNPTSIASDITGCGFGVQTAVNCGGSATSGSLIYRGTASVLGSATLTDDGAPAGILDQSSNNTDNQNGITTNGLGLQTVRVNVDTVTFDPTFFLSNITNLATDIQHTEQGGGSPFIQANPSNEVVGNPIAWTAAERLATYGVGGRNDFVCGAAQSPCDIHLQSDASSTILSQPTPEPGSLALLGLGFAALGVGLRRRTKAQ